jgi:anthranilate phosphoribosyltransferase
VAEDQPPARLRAQPAATLHSGPEIAVPGPETEKMSIAPYIREIGRGRDGARSLDSAQAHDLMSQVLDQRVTDLEIGAFALAMRIKGESVTELAGFLDAAHERCIAIRTDVATVVLPSYNGSRKIPNLTALLALLLTQQGLRVLVHGPVRDGTRVTTAEIFRDLGLTCAGTTREIEDAWSRREPVFVRTEVLCPPLARLLEVRNVVGLRNPGHTVAKLLAVCRSGPTLRVVNYTHPEYGTRLAEFIAHTRADAMLMRGTEGEPVADARRRQALDVYFAGEHRADLSLAGQQGVVTEMPVLPRTIDAPTTASYIQAIVSGAMPAPPAITAQVECLSRALGALDGSAVREVIGLTGGAA